MTENNKLIIAVDFDGTLCKNNYPFIGMPNAYMILKLKRFRELGHKLILWTCREGKELDEAVNFCKECGLEFDAVNTNLDTEIERWKHNPRKIGADVYIDDKNISIDMFEEADVSDITAAIMRMEEKSQIYTAMGDLFCPTCGMRLFPDEKFCAKCGQKLLDIYRLNNYGGTV